MKLIDPAKCWFVVRSQIRGEEKAASSIRQAGFDVYLPRMKEEKKPRRKNIYVTVERPLMPGYLFVGFTSFARHFGMVRDCDGVASLLSVQGEPIQIPSKAVVDIQVAEMDMKFDDTRAARIHRGEEERTRKLNTRKKFPKGASATVIDEKHPFAHFDVVIDDVTSSGNVRTLIDLFGQMVKAEFREEQLKPAA